MDFESCFDQMVTLMGPSPSTMNKVYKLAKYRKKTKNQWARDDPAFALVQVGFLLVSTAAWGVAVQGSQFSLGRFVVFFLNDLLGYWLAGGVVLSGLCASFANARLIEHSVHSVAQTVEWMYAFDIHCNGFFVSFLLTHVLQFLLLPLLLADSLLATAASATLWLAALGAYFFVTHLGYRALPFLNHTEFFLYPIAVLGVAFVAIVVAAVVGYRINITQVRPPCFREDFRRGLVEDHPSDIPFRITLSMFVDAYIRPTSILNCFCRQWFRSTSETDAASPSESPSCPFLKSRVTTFILSRSLSM
jgi:hypothetical protein